MSDRWIVIPRWEDFQHRDAMRSSVPKWIKNYTQLLSSDEYLELTLMQRGMLHGLWLMYAQSRSKGISEYRARTVLSTKLGGEQRHFRDNLTSLEQAGFIEIRASRPARKVAGEPAGLEEKRREDIDLPSFLPELQDVGRTEGRFENGREITELERIQAAEELAAIREAM